MKFIPCTSSVKDGDITDGAEPLSTVDNGKKSLITSWFDNVRNIFGDRTNRRIQISEPVPLSKDDAAQVNCIVEIRSPIVENTEKTTENQETIVSQSNPSHTLNNETNTEEKISNNYSKRIYDIDHNSSIETDSLLNHDWFWGDISRRDAENLLRGQEEGTFLVRKSSDQRFLYSLSFRSNDKTLHTRIECLNGLFYFYSNDPSSKHEIDGSSSLVDLIEDAMNQNNAENIFFYSRGLKKEASLHTITLLKPLSRFQYVIDYNYTEDEPKGLQYLCKFILHHSPKVESESTHTLLPEEVKKFLGNQHSLYPCAKTKERKK